MKKKGVTLGDVLAHIQALSSRMAAVEGKIDAQGKRLVVLERIEQRLDQMNIRLDSVDGRLTRMETILYPSVTRLQLIVRSHGTRIQKLEREKGVAV